MGTPYSKDLRQKIVDTYLEDNQSVRKVAKRFKVSPSFVHNLLQSYRQTGTLDPKPYKGGRSPKLNSQQLNVARELIKRYDRCTLQELCHLLKEQIGVEISNSTMSRITQKIK